MADYSRERNGGLQSRACEKERNGGLQSRAKLRITVESEMADYSREHVRKSEMGNGRLQSRAK
jgi:hypothetical protein